MNPVEIAHELNLSLAKLSFSEPVTHVYNPAEYAWEAHADYMKRYGEGRRDVVFFGMNPGPWGMVQTGVPFGEIAAARDFLGIKGEIHKPKNEHPKRPIDGFECTRSEVSGRRLWGWVEERFGTPQEFFKHNYVTNYCPLAFMEEGGRNRTPDKLPADERDPLIALCDQALAQLVDYFEPEWVIGVGAFAETRAQKALVGKDVRIGRLPHPSPASPAANRGWSALADNAMKRLDIF